MKWSEKRIRTELSKHVSSKGRMPSINELKECGRNDLACAVGRSGGIRLWASKFGVDLKSSETRFGNSWEKHEFDFFVDQGARVEAQSCRSPFDLLVNGYRVDVKTSTLNKTGWYQFGGIKKCLDCDFLDLLCVSEDGDLRARFVVPADKARVTTVSMMPATLEGLGKYASFRDKIESVLNGTSD